MKLLIASNNKGKLREIKQILGSVYEEIVTPKEIGLLLEVEENGQTFLENARIKAHAFAKAAQMDALADDSGLCVEALGGAPGVYSARYAGGHGDDAANNALLLKNMETVPDGKRGAKFVCSVVLASPDGRETWAEGESAGEILRAPQRGQRLWLRPAVLRAAISKELCRAFRRGEKQHQPQGTRLAAALPKAGEAA